jgi:hypothetical protein
VVESWGGEGCWGHATVSPFEMSLGKGVNWRAAVYPIYPPEYLWSVGGRGSGDIGLLVVGEIH